MGIEIKYFETYEELSKEAVKMVAEAITKKPELVLGLPTGSTPVGMYQNLIGLYKSGGVNFANVRTFNLDEYYPIKRSNEQSYYKFMFDNLFGSVNIKPENIHIPDGETNDPVIECTEYDVKIDSAGGIDLMVLGIGANGHIGFNEPDASLIPGTHIAELTENTIQANARFFNSADEVPKKALTMGVGSIIAKSRKILLLVSGESKTQIFRQLLSDNKISTANPATLLHLHHDVTIFSDIKNI